MALIVCNNCGKKISDTIEKCIHCGALIKVSENRNSINICEENDKMLTKEKQKPLIDQDETVNRAKFKNLSKDQQLKYEQEFVNSDKRFYNLKRREAEFEKVGNFAFLMIGLTFAIFIGMNWIIAKFGLQLYNEGLYDFSMNVMLTILVASFALIIINFIMKITYKRSIKRFIYMKGLKLWLEKEKNVDFSPPFLDDKEKEIFDDIDLETIIF